MERHYESTEAPRDAGLPKERSGSDVQATRGGGGTKTKRGISTRLSLQRRMIYKRGEAEWGRL